MLSCCLNSSAYEKWGFPVQKKWGCPFDLFFQEQFFKKSINKDKSDLVSSCYPYSYKKVFILQRNI